MLTNRISTWTSPEAHTARRWFVIAVGSLLAAGVLALLLVVGRLPGVDAWLGQHVDALLFKRTLVLHVDLALVVWFYAFASALLCLLPRPGDSARHTRFGPPLAMAGLAAMVAAVLVPGVQPVLSNYVPMLDHPLWSAGLVVFGAGVLLGFLDSRLRPGSTPSAESSLDDGVGHGLRAAALALIVAAITFAISAFTTPEGLEAAAYYELLVWGGGHVLQLASEAAMVAVWLLLVGSLAGRPVLGGRLAAALFGLLVAPWLIAPWLVAGGTATVVARVGFTRLMQYAIFPVVGIFLVLCVTALVRAGRRGDLPRPLWRDARFTGFVASAGLTLLGFGIGAMIRGSNTMVPGHYHASIGAVTVAFMAATPVLLHHWGLHLPAGRSRRLVAWQPLVYGIGQSVFAGGFAMAGAFGAARKTYAAEQVARSTGEVIGLGVMAAGGLVALAGGVLFLAIALSARRVHVESKPRSLSWQTTRPLGHTRSRS